MSSQTTYANLDELRNEFEDLETAEERIQTLIELGQSLPEFPAEFGTEDYRVVGCQSMVWIVPRWDGEHFHFMATSDAPMVRGLVAVLMSAYSGKTPAQILAVPIDDWLRELHLKSFLSPLRSNGLHSMIRTIRRYAESKCSNAIVIDRKQSVAPSDLGPLLGRIDQIRADFPILGRTNAVGIPVAYLDNAASSQRPNSVIEAMSALYGEHYANVHRSGHEWAAKTTEKLEASRQSVQRFMNAAKSEEVIMTAGATASINLIANAWGNANLQRGDEILLTQMEHHSNIVPWHQLCERVGCSIRWVPIRNDFTIDLDRFASLFTSKTKLVSFTAVSNVLGTINPVKEMVRLAHRHAAVAVVDAAQATPHGSIDVREWDAEFVVFSGHKMLASSGVGVCYGKQAILEAMPAWQGGGSMIKAVTMDGFTLADLPHKFEAGTPPIAEIVSLKPAIEYLESIGNERIIEYERLLVGKASEGLSKIDGIKIYSPALEIKSGVLSFSVDGFHGEEIGRILDSRGIAIRVGHHCAMPLHSVLGCSVSCRASFYLYNTLAEVDRFVAAVSDAVRLLRS
ncbi:MAG: SufS family cysteine desulfurase [Pirellula sp.]